jgi:two-component system cell cycle sensor histidine kinase/response regulator CckA
VDDEESLRNLAVRLLQRQGYEVIAAADGAEAVEAIRREPRKFDLVVLDVIMPGMDGRDVAQAVQQIRADLPILFTSGCDASTILDPAGHPENFKVLPKPWQPNRLVEVVGQMLSVSDK